MLDNRNMESFNEAVYQETLLSCRAGQLEPVRCGANAVVLLSLGITINSSQIKEEALDMLYKACVETGVDMTDLT